MTEKGPLEKIGGGSVIIAGGMAVGVLFQYLLKIILARFMDPATYGLYVQALSVSQTATAVAMLGVHMAVPRFISYYRGTDDRELIQETLSTSTRMVIFSSISAFLLLYIGAGWISTAVFKEPALVTPLRIFSFTVIPLAFVYLLISFFRGNQNSKFKVILDDFVFSSLILAVISSIVFLGGGLRSIGYGYIIVEVLTVAVGYYLYRKVFDFNPLSGETRYRNLGKFMWPLFIISVLLAVNKWLGIWLIGWGAGSVEVGVFNVAYTVAGSLTLILSALNYMFMPVVSELHGRESLEEIRNVYRNTVRWIIICALPVFVGAILFPSELIRIGFGSSYVEGANALRILSLGFFVMVATGPAGEFLLALGRTRSQMSGIACITAVTILSGVFLVPRYGIEGAASATMLGIVSGHLLLFSIAVREIGELPYSRAFLRFLPAAGIPFTSIWVIKAILEPGLVMSVLLGGLFTIMYVCLLFYLNLLGSDDKEVFVDPFRSYLNL